MRKDTSVASAALSVALSHGSQGKTLSLQTLACTSSDHKDSSGKATSERQWLRPPFWDQPASFVLTAGSQETTFSVPFLEVRLSPALPSQACFSWNLADVFHACACVCSHTLVSTPTSICAQWQQPRGDRCPSLGEMMGRSTGQGKTGKVEFVTMRTWKPDAEH